MAEILEIPEAVFVIKIFVAICLIVIAVYAVLKIREFAAGTMPKSGEYLTEFEKLREQGLIDDKELGHVKSAVGKTLDDPATTPKVDDSFDG